MKKNLFLTTVLLVGLIAPAFADDVVPNTDKKITGGAGTCTVDVLGVSDNNATANTIATWSLNSYECAAGQYLDETTLNCTECPIGSYCPGGTFTVEVNNSKNTCPADYTSDAAATAESECYMGCETQCTPAECPANATECTPIISNTTGKQYVGGTCGAHETTCRTSFKCKTGYTAHDLMMSDIFPVGADIGMTSIFSNDGQDCFDSGKCPNFQEGYFSISSTVFGGGNYTFDTGEIYEYVEMSTKVRVVCNEYSPNTPGTFTKTYTNRNGETKTATMLYHENFNAGENNQYCWARPTHVSKSTRDFFLFDTGNFEYMENQELANLLKEVMQKVEENPDYIITEAEQAALRQHLSSLETYVPLDKMPWMYIGEFSDISISSLVANNFARNNVIYAYSDYHAFIDCTFNIINTNWNPDNGGDVIQNQCAYDGAVTLPDDPVRPGYTFTGWKLVD